MSKPLPTGIIGRTETKQVWAVLEGPDTTYPDITYFHDAGDEDAADPDYSAQDAARDYSLYGAHRRLALLTVKSEIVAGEIHDEDEETDNA